MNLWWFLQPGQVYKAISTPKNQLKPEQVKYLPKNYILTFDTFNMLRLWSYLPEKYKRDMDIQLRRPCYDHHNRPEDRDHIDGIPPSKLNCIACRRERTEKMSSHTRSSSGLKVMNVPTCR